jgi:hypothetical protein
MPERLSGVHVLLARGPFEIPSSSAVMLTRRLRSSASTAEIAREFEKAGATGRVELDADQKAALLVALDEWPRYLRHAELPEGIYDFRLALDRDINDPA